MALPLRSLSSRFPTALALIALLPFGASYAQDSDVAALTKKLDDATSHFVEVQQKARQNALAGFDKMISEVKNAKIPASVKVDKTDELAKAKQQFDDKGTFPSDAEYVSLQLKYFLEINKSYRPLSKLHDQLMDKALKNNDDALLKKLQKEKKSLDKQLPGVASFVAGSKWNGTLSLTSGNSVQYHVRVDKLTGNLFKGYVLDNPSIGGHPEYEVEGTIDGLEVKFEATKVVQGGTAAAVFKGILTGDRMIGTLDQINAKGKHYPGVIVVNLGK